MTSYETIYGAFFNKIEMDSDFFIYNNVSSADALVLAQTRARKILEEAISMITLRCALDIDLILDDTNEEISPSLTRAEINIITSLMYEVYLSRDIATLKTMTNMFTSSQIKTLYSPANERKTFMDMYKYVCEKNNELFDAYSSRDRNGKRKTIDYEKYDSYDEV